MAVPTSFRLRLPVREAPSSSAISSRSRRAARCVVGGALRMSRGPEQRDTFIVLATAAALQLILFAYDAAMKFYPIVHGDRSQLRWSALHALRGADPSKLMDTLTASQTVPGEYVFAYAAYAFGGPAAIIVLQMVLFLLSRVRVRNGGEVSLEALGSDLRHRLRHSASQSRIHAPTRHRSDRNSVRRVLHLLLLSLLQVAPCLGCGSGGINARVAIFVRPPLLLIAPALIAMHVLYRRYFWVGATRAVTLLACIALLPMAVWTAAFTSHTGHFGYTSGVANFAWNLRSKVYLVHARNGLRAARGPEAVFHLR